MNMSDVLFDTGSYTLTSQAQQKLAKISGILAAHPGLRLEIDGYTDNTGDDAHDLTLSEQRAQAVRDYLATQGVPDDSMKVRGFGESRPVASNATARGRKENRRVEMVVSGSPIGAEESDLGRCLQRRNSLPTAELAWPWVLVGVPSVPVSGTGSKAEIFHFKLRAGCR